MATRAFIAGITGQDGAYLAKLLLEKGYDVHGGHRRLSGSATVRLAALGIDSEVTLHDLDLLEITNIQRILEKVAPSEIYNLAAQSFVAASFDHPLLTAGIDGLGAMRILECLRASGSTARFYQASTSEMFGKVSSWPQDENTPFYPRSPYGIAKLFGHWATVNYREAYALFACSGILFNHESPLRGIEFVTRKITHGFARIRHGLQDAIELGNMDAARDWGFAGDYVVGMWLMLQQQQPDDYVLASGKMHTVREFAEQAGRYFGWELVWRGSGITEEGLDRASGRVLVRVNPAFFRPTEVDRVQGRATKAERALGWSRTVDFAGLVTMMAASDDLAVARLTQ
jgi:GDPmannose 4,6-dehydratase